MNWIARATSVALVVAVLGLAASAARAPGAPVFAISHEGSSIKFNVKASVPIQGTFDKWDAALTFTSPDVDTGVLDVKIDADSVNTGS
ncbi:MAG: YceI family protein, partial [Candidatus Acidiferrales bacterium]